MGAPKHVVMSKTLIPYVVVLGLVGFVGGSSTFDQDKAECGEKLVGLATCLNFVGGEASSPTPSCCSGLKQVVEKSTKCLCLLIKDRNEPKLGIKFNITRTMQLPSTCHVPLNLTTCIDLLHLAHNSSDAKTFEEFAESLRHGSNVSTPVPAFGSSQHGNSSTEEMGINNGGKGKRWNYNMRVLVMAFVTYLLWIFINPHVALYV